MKLPLTFQMLIQVYKNIPEHLTWQSSDCCTACQCARKKEGDKSLITFQKDAIFCELWSLSTDVQLIFQ